MKKVFILGSLASSLRNFRGPLVSAFLEKGCAVDAGAPGLIKDKATSSWLSERGVNCHSVPLSRTGLNPLRDAYAVFSLVRLMMCGKPDYFFGYTIKPVIWGVIAASVAGIPNRIALITGLGYAFTGDAKGKRALVQKVAFTLYRFALRRSTLIFFQNGDDRSDFERLGLLPKGIPTFVVNGSGVDLKSFSPAPFPETSFGFLLIARLLGDKGIREYVTAASQVRIRYPNVQFHLVGGLDPNPDGISESEVRSWHDSGHIVWHGELRDVRPAISACHVYVLPSYREGTPRTVLEAMAMGRPIITTDAPGCRETVAHGENGYLVPIKNVSALVEAMCRMIESPKQVAAMGLRSRVIVKEKYDVLKVNAQMLREMGLS